MKRMRQKSSGNDDAIKNLMMTGCRRLGLTPPKSKMRTSITPTTSPLAIISNPTPAPEPKVKKVEEKPVRIVKSPSPVLLKAPVIVQEPVIVKSKINTATKVNPPVKITIKKSMIKNFKDLDKIDVNEFKFKKIETKCIEKEAIEIPIQKTDSKQLTCDKIVEKENLSSNNQTESIAVLSPKKKKSKMSLSTKSRTSLLSLKSNKSLSQKSTSSNDNFDSDDDFSLKTIADKKKLESNNKNCDQDIEKTIKETEARLKSKLEELEKLKSNCEDPKNKELADLIVKWRTACQEALNELLVANSRRRSESRVGMEELLDLLHIPHNLVRYDKDEMKFY